MNVPCACRMRNVETSRHLRDQMCWVLHGEKHVAIKGCELELAPMAENVFCSLAVQVSFFGGACTYSFTSCLPSEETKWQQTRALMLECNHDPAQCSVPTHSTLVPGESFHSAGWPKWSCPGTWWLKVCTQDWIPNAGSESKRNSITSFLLLLVRHLLLLAMHMFLVASCYY